jgi:hypothetical protein
VGVSLIAGMALTLTAQSILQVGPSAISGAVAAEGSVIKAPQSWSFEDLNNMKLEELGKIDWITVESGGEYNSEASLFEGQNVVLVWDSAPARLLMDEPIPYDEFVVVLKGELILTDKEGNSVTYKKSDMFMLPKGFTGTWEMTEDFRELIVVDTKAYNGSL